MWKQEGVEDMKLYQFIIICVLLVGIILGQVEILDALLGRHPRQKQKEGAGDQ